MHGNDLFLFQKIWSLSGPVDGPWAPGTRPPVDDLMLRPVCLITLGPNPGLLDNGWLQPSVAIWRKCIAVQAIELRLGGIGLDTGREIRQRIAIAVTWIYSCGQCIAGV